MLIPCLDEEAAIAGVVRAFRAAREAGALVRSEPMCGKGNVVRRMFADIDADLFVLVDGDGTYPADRGPPMIGALIEDRLDTVTGARVADRQPPTGRATVSGTGRSPLWWA